MKTTASTLASGLTLALACLGAARAADADVAQQTRDCERQEENKGHGEKTSAAICTVKVLFQSRIHSGKEPEPVEMTVGSPPMRSDDTDTPGPNNWEVNLGMQAELAGGEHRIELPVVDINYGVGDALQLRYEVPYVFARQAEPGTGDGATHSNVHGVGDSGFGVKYRFYDDKDAGLSFAIYPQIQFRTPGASRRVSEGTTTVTLPVLMTREFEHASITANVGLEAADSERRYFASFGVGTRLTDHLAFFAEIAGADLNAADEQRVLLNFGARQKLSDTQSISAALGRDVHAGGELQEQTYVTFAYQMVFGH